MPKTNSSETLLKVENLVTYFYTSAGVVKAVDDVTFDVKHGEVVGIVGESGSGKSVTCLSILRVVPRPG
ncbi:MAG: ATP-binding cassette domain-containing protein, partial [Candidatus Kryptoniota bacterium]